MIKQEQFGEYLMFLGEPNEKTIRSAKKELARRMAEIIETGYFIVKPYQCEEGEINPPAYTVGVKIMVNIEYPTLPACTRVPVSGDILYFVDDPEEGVRVCKCDNGRVYLEDKLYPDKRMKIAKVDDLGYHFFHEKDYAIAIHAFMEGRKKALQG